MRETAEDVQQDDPPAPMPEPEPRTEPAPEPTVQEPAEDVQPARVTAGPLFAMTAETVTAAGAALWQVGGWTAVGLGAAGLVGAGAFAGRRFAGSRSRSPFRTRSWSTGRSWGSSGSSGRAGMPKLGGSGSSSSRRARSGMPSLGGSGRAAGRRAGMPRVGSRAGGMPGMGRRAGRAGFPGSGKRSGAAGRRMSSPALRGVGNTARRTARATGRGLDRTTAAAQRGRAAARAARQATREGASPRAASRAARAALKDAHRTVQRKGAWRRLLGSAAWGAAGWTFGQLHAWNRSMTAGLGALFALRRGHLKNDNNDGAEQPRIADTVDRPTNPAAGRSDGGTYMGNTSAGVPIFVAAAEDLAEAFKKYEPPPGPGGMVDMYTHVGMLPDALDQVSIGLNVLADRCRNALPLHPAIAELVHELAKAQAQMASVSAEIKPAIERLHADDLGRHRAPRPAERLWDVG